MSLFRVYESGDEGSEGRRVVRVEIAGFELVSV